MLVVDLRFEHVEAVHEHPISWTPIIYSGLMINLGIVGLIAWDRGGRQVLQAAFVAAFVVGLLGFWFHNHGHLIHGVTVLSAWNRPLQHTDAPPPLAPLSFLGLGLIGLLACARRFQPAAGSS